MCTVTPSRAPLVPAPKLGVPATPEVRVPTARGSPGLTRGTRLVLAAPSAGAPDRLMLPDGQTPPPPACSCRGRGGVPPCHHRPPHFLWGRHRGQTKSVEVFLPLFLRIILLAFRFF